ncbi:phytanoyl-CoA dioxygenase family protein [Phenylobacterium sp.]|uniref:phytanoyl-CoA dioxygenase family protein n=1 Tax=Phenylobacterium sp. TaxID=1871053 RepID=UPI0027377641|nr:phytanoyl-CoA dioxygenase family protein [Phenylobacterium sp.]MDP3659420.1 phytanoyl-CoA dioxygenase family protein [Phenylobacterium sp.]
MTLVEAAPARLPAATRDPEQAERDLAQHGVCIVEGVLQGADLQRARDALYHAAETDPGRGKGPRIRLDYGPESNQRVWNLLNRDRVFSELAEHPLAMRLLRSVIGWPALLSNISANITGPGGGDSYVHCDQQYMPEPWSRPQGINFVWCLDDFTPDNGATMMAPGSHLENRAPRPGDAAAAHAPLVAPAGSLCAFEGRVWHKTGVNVTADERRAGIFAWYTLPIYRQQENWYLSLNPTVLQFASPTLLELLGYQTKGFGLVNGLPPLWREEHATPN